MNIYVHFGLLYTHLQVNRLSAVYSEPDNMSHMMTDLTSRRFSPWGSQIAKILAGGAGGAVLLAIRLRLNSTSGFPSDFS